MTVRPVVVSDDLAAKSGLGKNHVRIKDKYGGGYPVFVEGLHQLHCLVSIVRQAVRRRLTGSCRTFSVNPSFTITNTIVREQKKRSVIHLKSNAGISVSHLLVHHDCHLHLFD